jgi:CRP/FNR family transcriptional regulator, anaerobic regulatory protein
LWCSIALLIEIIFYLPLLRAISKLLELSEDAKADVDRLFLREKYPKNAKLVLEGDICDKLFFVESGILRVYYVREGKEVTHAFRAEGEFTTAIDGFFDQKPTRYFIETLEPVTIRVISLSNLNFLFDQYKEVERLGRLIGFHFVKESAEHLYNLQFQTAKERYANLIEKHPSILMRVSLGTIASFLGITQETLSRIRAQH